MGKIRILPEHEARKVAAGEVVERPSNIVKELVENSLDAQAKTISIYIKKSGKELIRVLDDGCGMSASDAWLCVQSHATSKITNIDDLLTIATFGFRGEALPSIAAVSEFSLKTWDGISDDGMGIQVSVSYGQHHEKMAVTCSQGTDISVANLFDNIPVRKKFLKQDETEWNQIVGLVEAFALSHKDIHFKLFHDNGLVLNLPPVSGVKDRIAQCWGYNFAENMIEFCIDQEKHPWLKISGYVSNHNFWRYNRNSMFFFVNNRWVKYQELSKAAMKGYSNVLPPAKFPAVFIFMEVDAQQVDVNVHPKKEEVRFVHPVVVYKTIEEGIKNSLENLLTSKVSLSSSRRSDDLLRASELGDERKSFLSRSFDGAQACPAELEERSLDKRVVGQELSDGLHDRLRMSGRKDFFSQETTAPLSSKDLHCNFVYPEEPAFYGVSKEANSEDLFENNFKSTHTNTVIAPVHEVQEQGQFVGMLFNTYILIEQKGELVFIDQHAAHERVMYERFKNIFGKHEGTHLLFPVTMTVTENDLMILLERVSIFAQYGIEIDQAGKNSIVIKSTPSGLKNDYLIKELILETIGFIQENSFLEESVLSQKITEHVHSQMACKAAVKAGDILSEDQIRQLLKDLSNVENRFICAHGRPTTWSVSKRDIEKNFKRC